MDLNKLKRKYVGVAKNPKMTSELQHQWWRILKRKWTDRALALPGRNCVTPVTATTRRKSMSQLSDEVNRKNKDSPAHWNGQDGAFLRTNREGHNNQNSGDYTNALPMDMHDEESSHVPELYSSDSEDDSPTDDEDPHGKSTSRHADLFKKVKISNETTPAALLRIVFRHSFKNKTCFSGIVDHARIINATSGTQILPDTRYLFDKLCNHGVSYVLHAICPECSNHAGIFEEASPTIDCGSCGFNFKAMNHSDSCYFAIIDLTEAVRDLLELYEDYYDYVVNRREHDPNRMTDVNDGQLYIDIVEEFPRSPGVSHATGAMRYPHFIPPAPPRAVMNHFYLASEALREGKDYCLGVKPTVSPLINLKDFNIINSFVPEPTHQTSGGTGKQVTESILNTLPAKSKLLINHYLEKIRVPTQFGQYCRTMDSKGELKCREWENWILYFSIPTLSKVVKDEKILIHWGYLVDSTHLSQQSSITSAERAKIRSKLHEFSKGSKSLYTLESMTYNMHQSEHVADSIDQWEPAWAHSAYAFESANGDYADCVKSEKGVILQIIRHLNFHRFDHMLQQKSDPFTSKIVEGYCDGMVGGEQAKHLRVNSNTYLGKPRVVDLESMKKWMVNPSTKSYIKYVIGRCLFMSAEKQNRRSCNYFAQLKCGSFIKILKFLVDVREEKETTVCKFINVRDNCYARAMKEIVSFDEGEELIPTSVIEKICIHIEIESTAYNIPSPNM
ncbi:hypothetical protein QAD02_012638 [Eretmocerus hayati]|uniref:Uncharacterized protein n=1 Tax=Eretmocerus hayati TaxID=131215 RepID=A0ACC2P098_9HYME|nr:hypothetical protein QAD02_012638 [Eretmocerus hayati]